jgi:hypothetical protein
MHDFLRYERIKKGEGGADKSVLESDLVLGMPDHTWQLPMANAYNFIRFIG